MLMFDVQHVVLVEHCIHWFTVYLAVVVYTHVYTAPRWGNNTSWRGLHFWISWLIVVVKPVHCAKNIVNFKTVDLTCSLVPTKSIHFYRMSCFVCDDELMCLIWKWHLGWEGIVERGKEAVARVPTAPAVQPMTRWESRTMHMWCMSHLWFNSVLFSVVVVVVFFLRIWYYLHFFLFCIFFCSKCLNLFILYLWY